MKLTRYPLVAAATAAALLSSRLMAADADSAAPAADAAPAAPDSTLQDVIVTGTRVTGIKAIDSAAPVQVIGGDELAKTSATPDLISTLANVIPSLDTTTFGGDLSNTTLQAALRYLSPNDTLILVNGKRRHTTSNIGVAASGEFAGGAGADLNFIPADAIDHVEVLTDGAAAQYGSDAIAGVVNIILKKNAEGGNVSASYGQYQDGGGQTDDFTGNIGFKPYEGAWINLTGEYRGHGHTVRSAPLDYTLPSAFTQDASGAYTPVAGLYPAAGLQKIDANVLSAPGQPVLNLIEGDAQYVIKLVTFDSGFRLSDNLQFYAFGTFGQKAVSSIQNYRLPHIAAYTNPATGQTTYQYPYGFSPLIDTHETDYGITAGFKGVLLGWNWDLSSTYGRDHNDFYTDNSTNTTLYANTGYSPTSFYDGSFNTTQWTTNLDLDHEFQVGLAGPLNVALGAEQRRDAYVIGQGLPASYGTSALDAGGAAAFQGFSAYDAGGHSRTNSAGYIDLAARVIGGLRLDIAGRYENYSDFGSARSGKLTARYDFSPAFALRGTISNGFRAPTVAEEYYTKSGTSPNSATVQFAANSAAAQLFGLGKLQPETSVNYSLGLVFNPAQNFSGTLDLYQINLNHRIVATTTFNAYNTDPTTGAAIQSPAYDLVTGAIALNHNTINPALTSLGVNFFINGLDTRTQGVDLALDYLNDLGSFGRIDWSLKGNYNKTTVRGYRSTPDSLAAVGLTVLDAGSFAGVTDDLPKYTVQFGGLWTIDRLAVNLREIIRGSTNNVEAPFYAPTEFVDARSGVIPITNLDISYDVLKAVKVSVGGTNLFNRYPGKDPIATTGYQTYGFSFAAGQWASSPIGFNGGYYYLKATYTF